MISLQLLFDKLFNTSLIFIHCNAVKMIESGLVGRQEGGLNLLGFLLSLLHLSAEDQGSNLKLAAYVKQLILLLFVVPGEVSEFDNILLHEGHDKAIAEPLGQVEQVADVVFDFTKAATHGKLPALLGCASGFHHGLEEGFDVSLDSLSGHVDQLG